MKRPRFDLHQIAAASGKRIRRAVKLRPIEPTTALETTAALIGLRVVAKWREIMLGLLDAYEAALKVKTFEPAIGDRVWGLDAAGDNLAVLIDSGAQTMSRYVLSLQFDLSRWAEKVELWHRQKFAEGLKGGLGGIDVFPYLSGADVEDSIAAAIERNVALIKGLSAGLEKATSETVWREYLKQTPRRDIGRMLSDQLGVGRARANLIAKDQTIKLGAQLNQERQEQVGITQYIWRTAEDERVRPTHAVRNNNIYEWANESEIKPGEEINCRCTAQAYLEPLTEESAAALTAEPEPEVRLSGAEAEAHATVGETAAIEADVVRAAQLRKAEAAQLQAERAVAVAQRQAVKFETKLTQAQSAGLAEMQATLGSRAAANAALKAAEEKAALAKAQEKAAKGALTKAQNSVAKLKAMEGGSAEIDAIAEVAIKQIATSDPTGAISILKKAQAQILKVTEKADFAKEAWLKKYLKNLQGMMGEVNQSSKGTLKIDIDNVKAMLAKLEPPTPAAIISPPKIKPEDLTLVGSAKALGGIKDKFFYVDKAGEKWMFKPTPTGFAWTADAEEAASRIGKAVDPHSIEVHAMTVEGQAGSLQKFQVGSSSFPLDINPSSLSAQDVASIQREHVIDWAISNHDAHAQNFLRTAAGDIVGIDKGQAFKFLGKDELNTTYHPNEHPPLYNKFWKQVQSGAIKVDTKATFDAIDKLQAIPDTEYKRWLRPYAEGRFGKGAKAEDFLHDATARKHQLKADFQKFFDDLGLGKAKTVEQAISSIEPAKGLVPPADAHGGNFATALGLGGKFKSLYGFSSKELGGNKPLEMFQSLPKHVFENYMKLEKAFQEWKATGVLPKNLNTLVPEKAPPPPPPPPPAGTRAASVGDIRSGETKAMLKPKTTVEWKPIETPEAYLAQDVGDTAIRAVAQVASLEQTNAWNFYKGNGYRSINGALRRKETEKSVRVSKETKHLDALITHELPKDMLLHRGTVVPKWKTLEDALNAKDFVDFGFFSASIDTSTADGFAGSTVLGQQVSVKFTIRAKAGMKVLAGTAGERGFIFPRKMKWRILDAETRPSRYGGAPEVHLLIEPW